MKRLGLILLGVVGVLAGLFYARSVRDVNVLHAFTRVAHERVFTSRLGIPTAYRPCRNTPPPADGTVSRADCGEPGEAPLYLDELAAAAKSGDPASLRMSALAAVIWWDSTEASLDSAITQLSDALRLGGDSVPLLVGLSGVHLFRAQHMQSPGDLILALEYAEEALAFDASNEAALFNAALAAEALSLDGQARQVWDAYLAVDSTSLWANEAREHRAALREQPLLKYPTVTSTAAEVDSFAVHRTAEARNFGWDTVLGGWGSAMLTDSLARAESLLAFAERLGASLARHSGDATLTDAVASIRAASSDAAATRTLALAHRDYARGPTPDDPLVLDRVLALELPSPALRGWTGAKRAAALHMSRPGVAQALCDSLLSRIDSDRYPALAARLHWIAGMVLKGESSYHDANRHFKAAAEGYRRIRDAEYFGRTRILEGLTSHELGDAPAGYSMAHQGVHALRTYRSSLSKVLFDLAKYAERDGMLSAASAIQDEAAALAAGAGDTPTVLDGLLLRAQLRVIAGSPERGIPYLDSAAVLIPKVDPKLRSRYENLLRFSRALAQAGSIESSIAKLDSAVAYFTWDDPDALWRMQALMTRANLHLEADNAEHARADLESITDGLRRVSEREDAYHQRSAIIEQARSRFDQLVMLELREGRPLDALRALERGRVAFDPLSEARGATSGSLAFPPGQVALEYAFIGDTLLTWVVRDGSMIFLKQRVPREELRLAIERANAALATPEQSELADSHLRRLHTWLIGPVRNQLGGRDTPLVIIADGEIARVPFQALRHTEATPYLIEDHPLRFAATLAEARRPATPVDLTGLRALLVADPAFLAAEHGRLDPLDGARAEIDTLRRFYPGADTLSGVNATVEAFRARAPRANVIHYAGHALFNDTRPERSSLVLAGTRQLRADSVTSLDLGGVRLVVLSACSTLRARQGRSGGFAGLSAALMSAGAGGVVGSLWKVDDELAQPLMTAFHEEYSRSGDAVKALRQAQLSMLRSSNPEWNSPAAWAGFRYVGR